MARVVRARPVSDSRDVPRMRLGRAAPDQSVRAARGFAVWLWNRCV